MDLKEHLIFKNDILVERMKKNYSQSKLAKIIGIRRDQLSMIENGHRLPTPEILTKIKEELGCLFDDLYSKELQKIIFKK